MYAARSFVELNEIWGSFLFLSSYKRFGTINFRMEITYDFWTDCGEMFITFHQSKAIGTDTTVSPTLPNLQVY